MVLSDEVKAKATLHWALNTGLAGTIRLSPSSP